MSPRDSGSIRFMWIFVWVLWRGASTDPQRDWPRDQCVTVAQVRTGHSPLVAAYLHRIGRRDSAICPHCHSADETVEHLVFQCPAHDHARRDTWPGDTFTTDPRRLWSYLEWIGAVTPPRPGMRERERARRSYGYVDDVDSAAVSRQVWKLVEVCVQNNDLEAITDGALDVRNLRSFV